MTKVLPFPRENPRVPPETSIVEAIEFMLKEIKAGRVQPTKIFIGFEHQLANGKWQYPYLALGFQSSIVQNYNLNISGFLMKYVHTLSED